jgi:hypothetical protein|tara:strand:+ start:1449 stop:1670 length:222 start_codon:yes stop_codon:yes gene_type:complete
MANPNKIPLPAETWVELYAILSHYVLEYSSLDQLTETDENGDEKYTEEKQDEFNDIVGDVEEMLGRFFIKEDI